MQRVVTEDSVSVDQELDFGVPRGSVLGPRMCCMYTKPVLGITIGDTVVDCSSQVGDLGVIFDRVPSLRQHVSYT